MAYSEGSRLPNERASKLGHLSVVESEWVRSLIQDFEQSKHQAIGTAQDIWRPFETASVLPLKIIWVVDGSYVKIASTSKPPKEMAFVKTALLTIDKAKLDQIDKDHPHPLLLQDVLKNSALLHATVFPLKNVITSLGNNYDAIRNIVYESMKIDEHGEFYETLKWLAYQKWNSSKKERTPSFACPHCHDENQGLPFDSDDALCGYCRKKILLTDMIGFHLEMEEDSAPDAVASAYMLVMEHIMLFTAIRLSWNHSDKNLVCETLFIKDGPMTLRSQYSKLVPNIRLFLEHAKKSKRPVHIVGQEKSGVFFDHLSSIGVQAPPHTREGPSHFAVLTHDFVRREVYRAPDLPNPYGKRTNWGEKVYIKIDPGTQLVINVPTGEYVDDKEFPKEKDLIGFNRILATLPSLISHKFEGALFPIELANGIASMSSYPSAKILERFADDVGRR